MTGSTYGTKGPVILGVTWTGASVATILIGLRVYTRVKLVPSGTWALGWALLAFAFTTTAQAALTVGCVNGAGRHEPVIQSGDDPMSEALKRIYISNSIATVALGIGKIAAAAFLISLQGPNHKKGRWALSLLAASCLVLDTALVFYFLYVPCDDPEGIWNQHAPPRCHEHPAKFGYFAGSWNAVADLVLALYPIPLLWDVQTSVKIKVGACLPMSVGVLASVCAALRTYDAGSADQTYSMSDFWIWSITEMWLVLIAPSIAPVWPIFQKAYQEAASVTRPRGASVTATPWNNLGQLGMDRFHRARASSQPRPRTIRLQSESDEEMLCHDGILMKTDISVQHERSLGPSRRSSMSRPSLVRLKESASMILTV